MTYRRYLREDKPSGAQEEVGQSDGIAEKNIHTKNNDDRYHRLPGKYFVLSYQVIKALMLRIVL